MDPYQIQPAYIWRWIVHSLQRIDSVATVGQLSPPISLVLRVDEFNEPNNTGVKHLSIYSSNPNEVSIGTELENVGFNDEFNLIVTPLSVYEIKVCFLL